MTAQPIVVTILVGISMILQLIVGIMLIYLAYNEQDESNKPDDTRAEGLLPLTPEEAANDNFDRMEKAGRIHDRLSKGVTIGIFIILFINIIISGMGLGLPTGDDAKYDIEHLGIGTTTTTTTGATTPSP